MPKFCPLLKSKIFNNGLYTTLIFIFCGLLIITIFGTGHVHASNTSTFNQTINAGTLSIDIVDGSYASVASPSITMNAVSFSFGCQTAAGTLGTATEQIYVENPDAADTGWTASIAASNTTDVWDSAGTDYDFNDSSSSGCADGADADSLAGQMTVDASGGTVSVGQCSSCTTTDVSVAGSSSAFDEGTTDSITILTGAGTSDDIGDWTLQGVSISQTIPAEQPAASDYSIDMVLSVVAT